MQHENRPDLDQAEKAAEKALDEQRAVEKKAIEDQNAVRDKLTAEVMARNKANLEAYHANKNIEGLPAPVQHQPALIVVAGDDKNQQREQQVEQGTKALKAYKEAGFVTDARDPLVAVGKDSAEQAWAAEKAFRQRQQQLADRIADPRTPADQRERLDLTKTIEYHTHKADQLNNIIHMEQWMQRYSQAGENYIDQHMQTRDHHETQAALAAQKLHEFDLQRNSVPQDVQARMGHAAGTPPLQHNAQGQKSLASDPHLQALTATHTQEQANSITPALERLQQRREEARQAHSGKQPSAYVQAQLAEANGREKQIEEAKTAQADNRLLPHHKTEAERQATMTH